MNNPENILFLSRITKYQNMPSNYWEYLNLCQNNVIYFGSRKVHERQSIDGKFNNKLYWLKDSWWIHITLWSSIRQSLTPWNENSWDYNWEISQRYSSLAHRQSCIQSRHYEPATCLLYVAPNISWVICTTQTTLEQKLNKTRAWYSYNFLAVMYAAYFG